jgi:hypothetical protein
MKKNARPKKKLALASEMIRRLRSLDKLELVQARGALLEQIGTTTHSDPVDGCGCQ